MSQTDYEIITVNTLPGKPRRKKFQGRDYLVVDATLLREGVLNGSRGPLYYPPEEIAANPGIWNHVPIVVWHPKDSNGNPTLARQPEILEEYGIGLLFNDRYEDRKRLAEAWFDEKRTIEFDARLTDQYKILPRINNGKPVELSTGLHTANYPAPAESVFNAEDGTTYPYSGIARNYRPDHLATLPDQKGACSVNYGCGFNVNNTPDDTDVENIKLSGGQWVTTDAGNHLYIKGGNVVGGNPHVVKAATGGGGGEKDESGSSEGKSSGDEDGDKKHGVKLPSDRKKLTVQQTHAALKEMGYDLNFKEAKYDLKTKTTVYTVTKPDGSRVKMSDDQVKEIVYRGKATHNSTNDAGFLGDVIGSVLNALGWQPRSSNTGQYKPIGSGYGKDPYQSAAQKGAMSLTDDDIADGTSASAEVGEKGHNPISWVADEGKWEKAKSAAREGGYQEGSDQYWAVVSHIYKQMGGKKKPTTNAQVDWKDVGDTLSKQGLMPGYGQIFVNDESENTLDHVWYVGGDGDAKGFSNLVEKTLKGAGAKRVTYESEGFPPKNQSWVQVYPERRSWITTNEEDTEMAKPDDIKYLTANCECWKGKDTILANMTDAEVASWKAFHEKAKKDEHVANAVVTSGFTVNAEGKIQASTTATENEAKCSKCGGKMKDGKCESCGYTEKATMNTLNLDDPKLLDAVSTKLFGLTANESKAVMNSAKKVEQRERFNLVHQLTANIEDETLRKEKVTQLLKQPTEQLEMIASLMPKQSATTNAQNDETTLFMQTFYGKGSREGSQGAPTDFVGNRGQHIEDKPDVEGGPRIMPTLNYDECSDVGKKVRKQKTA